MQSFELSDLNHSLPADEAIALRIADAVETEIDISPAAEEAMNREASLPTMQATLTEQIQGLCASAVEVDKSFKAVKNGLQLIELYQTLSGKRPNFPSEWAGLQGRWRALLQESRRTATKAEAYVKDFTEVIIPMAMNVSSPDDVKECQTMLAYFMKRGEEGELNHDGIGRIAQEHSDSYGKLKDDVETFKIKFTFYIPASRLKKVDEELRQVESKIEFLENTHDKMEPGHISLIEEMQRKALSRFEIRGSMTERRSRLVDLLDRFSECISNIVACSAALGIIAKASPLAVTSLGVGPTTAIAAGAAGVVIVGGMLLLVQYWNRVSAEKRERMRKEEISQLYRRQDRLKRGFRGLRNLQERMNAQTPTMNGILIGLDGFEAVWALVQHDADLISNNIKEILNTPPSLQNAFKRRMNKVQVDNANLAQALSKFATISTRTRR